MKWVVLSLLLLAGVFIALYITSGRNQNVAEVSSENIQVERVVEGLKVPWSLVFTSPTRMLVTEREGRIRIVENGKLLEKPLITFPDISSKDEEGLMGMALHPRYSENKYIYVSYAHNNPLRLRVVRLKDQGSQAEIDKTIIDNIPAAVFHAGSRIAFGPDGYLYITTGDALKKDESQNVESLAGKILRITDEGEVPSDNPYPRSPVFSIGHRNPQGIAWHPQTGELWSTEHGPSLFDGPEGGDELNKIEAGKNYGWPLVSHEKKRDGTEPPFIIWTPAIAPASALFYTGKIEQLKNTLLIGALRGEGIYRVYFKNGKPTTWDKLAEVSLGRIRDVVQGPDGYVYFTTSNRDGRGVRKGDDAVYRLL